jgi:hypothetical protein
LQLQIIIGVIIIAIIAWILRKALNSRKYDPTVVGELIDFVLFNTTIADSVFRLSLDFCVMIVKFLLRCMLAMIIINILGK